MLFNSIDFLLFFAVVFILYWIFSDKLKVQNLLLLVFSYIFYGFWDYRFLFLIIASTTVDFIIGNKLLDCKDLKIRKYLLYISIVFNLGLLAVFKYFNFFIENFKELLSFFGASTDIGSLNIILPVGISFYTFQTMSYTIDIYRGKLNLKTDFISFATYVSFFPQLVAGPIERATNLLPQFHLKRKFNYDQAIAGSRQVLWGFFKKVVIADNCAIYVNHIFENFTDLNSCYLILGAVLFAFQIYCDFSGYSSIAIGISKILGINLMQNFAFPYFSRDIAEFWRRWHISLSTWFRDYLYIPLGGSRGTKFKSIRNIFIIFIVSGFWHGANWTFIIWGFLNALYFLPQWIGKTNRANLDVIANNSPLPSLKEFASVFITFGLTCIAWVFFRASSVEIATTYLLNILTSFNKPINIISSLFHKISLTELSIYISILFIVEWVNRKNTFGYAVGLFRNRFANYLFHLVLTILVFMFFNNESEFIYFQF